MLHHDGECHHPLGGASYYFRKDLLSFLARMCRRSRVIVHIGAQPNCNPHIGNVVTFAVAFALASFMKRESNLDIRVKFVFVETAPATEKETTIDGVQYQVNLERSGEFASYQKTFSQLLLKLSSLSGVPVEIDGQDFWRKKTQYQTILQGIIRARDTLGPQLSPGSRKLAIRAPCPRCGLEDKHGIKNRYIDDHRIVFICPIHGGFERDMRSSEHVKDLGMNTPLRNLVRMLVCKADEDTSWIMCTGGDYAGFYQEQLMYRLAGSMHELPVLLYAPLILDWSGSKLSKSLYVRQGAYEYMHRAGLGYMLDAKVLLELDGGVVAVMATVNSWVSEPYRLFRDYSVEYLHQVLIAEGLQLPHQEPEMGSHATAQ